MAVGAQVLRQTNVALQDFSPAIALCLSDTLKCHVTFQSPPTFRRDSNAKTQHEKKLVIHSREVQVGAEMRVGAVGSRQDVPWYGMVCMVWSVRCSVVDLVV
jgi:hypothetical protein